MVQGLTALRVDHANKAVEAKLLESAAHNIGRNGQYKGVGAHLTAYACLQAKHAGYDTIYFEAKSNLTSYYEATLGAKQLGSSQRMTITGKAFEKLINEYYGEEQ